MQQSKPCFPVSANPVQGLPPADRLRTRPLMKTRLDKDPIKLFFDVRFKFLHRRINGFEPKG